MSTLCGFASDQRGLSRRKNDVNVLFKPVEEIRDSRRTAEAPWAQDVGLALHAQILTEKSRILTNARNIRRVETSTWRGRGRHYEGQNVRRVQPLAMPIREHKLPNESRFVRSLTAAKHGAVEFIHKPPTPHDLEPSTPRPAAASRGENGEIRTVPRRRSLGSPLVLTLPQVGHEGEDKKYHPPQDSNLDHELAIRLQRGPENFQQDSRQVEAALSGQSRPSRRMWIHEGKSCPAERTQAIILRTPRTGKLSRLGMSGTTNGRV
ncbi:hypothetical protein B0H21DRAFT_711999 [Amylocystis lapponica]|nr:hypothetical protein B0H21DRAFT_711999 [Amylocystis lapponica]